ncbi:MAG: hypothetical protein M3Y53_02185 [Thermoproteota archaeon]|nr:hypothetical protein [Thermoproteota archaeon]
MNLGTWLRFGRIGRYCTGLKEMTIEKATVSGKNVARLEELLDEGHGFAYASIPV